MVSAKRIFNILADRVETVAPWIAERVLANTMLTPEGVVERKPPRY